jgi:phosphonopyruvate decarboxylase
MVHKLFKKLISEDYKFFTGVPDSGLKPFQDAIINSSHPIKHVIAANEGQAIGIAVGAELAGIKSCVYLQNSGLGNTINPLTSLCIPHDIMPLLVVGHRHTLPQHKVMGEIDEEMLKLIGYKNYIIVRGDNNAN